MSILKTSKRHLRLISVFSLSLLWSAKQSNAQSPGLFNYTVRFSMQGYNLPFKNILDNFKNPGIAFGIEYGYNPKKTMLQSLNIGWLNHAEHGNALYFSSQFNYRPHINRFQPGIAAGIGRVIYFNNSNPLFEQVDSRWMPSKSQTESRWTTPISIDFGYALTPKSRYSVVPFVGYEISPAIKYNNAFPLLPTSLFTIGSRLNIQSK